MRPSPSARSHPHAPTARQLRPILPPSPQLSPHSIFRRILLYDCFSRSPPRFAACPHIDPASPSRDYPLNSIAGFVPAGPLAPRTNDFCRILLYGSFSPSGIGDSCGMVASRASLAQRDYPRNSIAGLAPPPPRPVDEIFLRHSAAWLLFISRSPPHAGEGLGERLLRKYVSHSVACLVSATRPCCLLTARWPPPTRPTPSVIPYDRDTQPPNTGTTGVADGS